MTDEEYKIYKNHNKDFESKIDFITEKFYPQANI